MKGLYIHIPFCKKKCNYCDFASYPSCISRADEYIEALCREMQLYKGEKLNTIYFGGGTPSILSSLQLGKILNSVFGSFKVSQNAEITLEANPGTVDFKKAKEISSMGINRISLGAQSFSDSELKTLGRLHSSKDTLLAYSHFENAGITNISLDLMYALPGQTMSSLSTSIEQMLKLKPKHLSCYGLKIEDGTPFYSMLSKGEIKEKSDDEYADMYEMICRKFSSSGYVQYELSNFSIPDYESKHNVKYWSGKEYIGIGLGASSYYKDSRFTRTTDFNKYLNSFENSEFYKLSKEDKMSEYMFLSLRLTKRGAVKEEFKKLFGMNIESIYGGVISKHIKNGFILDTNDSYLLAPKAYYISNSVLCDFV